MAPPPDLKTVKVNLGCGLAVAKGWVNVDGSLNSLVASWPEPVQRLLYRTTGAQDYYSCDEYLALLNGHDFIHHDLSYGIPFADKTLDYIYTSHFLEHLHKKDARTLLLEAYRTLKPGGIIRVCIPDLEYAVSLYNRGLREKMLDSYFFVDEESYFARHKYMYDFELLRVMLETAGFRDVRRWSYQQGMTPDIVMLDNRPEDTLFVEAMK